MLRDSAYDDDTDETAWYNAPEAASSVVHHYYNHSDHQQQSPHHRQRHHHHPTTSSYSVVNHTVTTSVSIRVTPLRNYYWSWSILWGCFVVVTCIAAGQVLYEYLMLRRRWRRRRPATKDSPATGIANADRYAVVVPAVEDAAVRPTPTEAESISTADLTRSMVSVSL
jgi:hypothetical protein